MRSEPIKPNREKVTVTLAPHVLQAVDRWRKQARIRSRSAAIERFVERSIDEEARRQLETDTEAYYLSLAAEEKEEDRSWAKSSSKQAIRRYERD